MNSKNPSVIVVNITLDKETEFYNAMGTKDDRISSVTTGEVYDSAIKAWETYNSKCKVKCYNLNCDHKDNEIVGAHIVLEKPKRDLKRGEPCYIVPLCNRCNTQGSDEMMKLSDDVPVLQLEF